MNAPRRLVVASRNSGKVSEIRAVLSPLSQWQVERLPPDAPDAEETGATFLENAALKARFYGELLGGWTVADDSGLEVDALGGRPGIHSARYAPTDTQRNAKLLAELREVHDDLRTARFVCALALALNGEVLWTVEEQVSGRIAAEPAGGQGFGYDPVFLLPDLGQTMGEIPPGLKNRLSHRGRALARLLAHLEGPSLNGR